MGEANDSQPDFQVRNKYWIEGSKPLPNASRLRAPTPGLISVVSQLGYHNGAIGGFQWPKNMVKNGHFQPFLAISS